MLNNNSKNIPKVIFMTQTRKHDFKSLDIYKSLLTYIDSKFIDIKFLINHQKKSIQPSIRIEEHDNFLLIKTPFISLSEAQIGRAHV